MTAPASQSPAPAAKDAKQAGIDALRARYESLLAQGQGLDNFAARIAAAPRIAHEIPSTLVRLDRVIPAGWYWYGLIPAATCLRLDNDLGTPGVACLLWNAADPGERLCVADTVKVQWTSRIGRGRMLLSDMGRVLASIVEDNCGRHDALLGAGLPRLDDMSSPLVTRNGHENLILGAAKLGLGVRDVHAPVTFFAPVWCDADQHFVWDDRITLAGTYVDLHAEMDLLAVVSNMPHPLAPAALASADMRLTLWQPEDADIARFCREATDEARRAHAHTGAYLKQKTSHGRARDI